MKETLINKVVTTHGFLNPQHYNAMRYGGSIEGSFIADGLIEAKGEHYRVINQPHFRTDEPVLVYQANAYDLAYETVRERKEREQMKVAELKRQLEEEEIASEKRKQQRREIIASFYESYEIPFRFSPQIKIVLSGLSEHSWGDGTRKNTVHHLYVHETFQDGRLKRNANSYLCSPNEAGKFHDFILDDREDDMLQNKENNTITCSNCLKLMERWKK